jgi:hypothetical protein
MRVRGVKVLPLIDWYTAGDQPMVKRRFYLTQDLGVNCSEWMPPQQCF